MMTSPPSHGPSPPAIPLSSPTEPPFNPKPTPSSQEKKKTRRRKTHLPLHKLPPLLHPPRQPPPNLPPHRHVLARNLFKPPRIPRPRPHPAVVPGPPPLHQPLVALAARIRRLGRKVRALQLAPVLAAGARRQQRAVVGGRPGAVVVGRGSGGEGVVGVVRRERVGTDVINGGGMWYRVVRGLLWCGRRRRAAHGGRAICGQGGRGGGLGRPSRPGGSPRCCLVGGGPGNRASAVWRSGGWR